MNVLDFMQTPDFMGDTFQGESWESWRAVLSGAFALPMDDDRLATFKRLAGDREPPAQRVRELWVVAGRRSAKTHNAAAVAVYLATVGAALEGLADKLSTGERGVVAVMAVDRNQAKVALAYIRGMIEASPVLSRMVERETTEGVDLNNRVSIEVHTSNHRAVRGRTMLALLMDEVAYLRSDASANPDKEIYRAAVPGLATTGGLLIAISSPYAQKGLLYEKHAKHYGQNSDVLVVQGGTLDFNPTMDRRVIDDALADDPEGARAEWLGLFRSGIASFVPRDALDAVTRPHRTTLPYDSRHRYVAFVDPAGGGADEYTLAIGHKERDRLVVDLVTGKRGTPADITADYAALMKQYGITQAHLDKYGGSWPADELQKHGITANHSPKVRSELYLDSLSAITSGRVELPPDEKMLSQWEALERRTSRSGKDIVDHPPGMHEDRANACAGLIALHGQGAVIDYAALL